MPGDGDTLCEDACDDDGYKGSAGQKPGRSFTWRELSKLNKRHNAHVAYRGKVYDVSGFVHSHPGGMEQIMLGAGRDITQLFESYHSLDVTKLMKQYYAGELVDNELPVFPEMGSFYATLLKRVDEHFKANKIDPKVDNWMFLRYIVFLSFTCICWYLMLHFSSSLLLGILFSVGWGYGMSLVGFTIAHDSSHFAITHKPWMWKMTAIIAESTLYSGYVWAYSHLFGHHVYTNIDGADPDIATLVFWRIKWKQKWLPRHFYQHVYMPAVYGFFGLWKWFVDFTSLLSLDIYGTRMNPPTLPQIVNFFGCKLLNITFRVIIPYFYMPLSSLVLYNIVAALGYGYWAALITECSHCVSEVDWPQPDDKNVIRKDWAEMQVRATQDFAVDSWFWTVFTGAHNHQTAHHLFPGVLQSHYAKITPILKQTCEDFGVEYHCVDTAGEALWCHIQHLKRLGQTVEQEQEKETKKD